MGNGEAPPIGAAGRLRQLQPVSLVVFGGCGDLTQRKLAPAIYRLFSEGLLPERFALVGFARHDEDDDSYRALLRKAVDRADHSGSVGSEDWDRFAQCIHYHRGDFDEDDAFRRLGGFLNELAQARKSANNALFYLATPPQGFAPIVEKLGAHGLVRKGCARQEGWSRLVIEKPFGRDLHSARDLTARIRRVADEDQIFRIDHYLGKETVQNLLVFRFANSIFEPVWNQKYVDHVQITVAESAGIGSRGKYYDQAGALRDMVQNHMMHLLCLTAMESPVRMDATAVRDEKIKVLHALRPIPFECAANNVVRAQYGPGTVGKTPVVGYRQEKGVAADSSTETYVAFAAHIDNWRWAGVPFYLRHGKRLAARVSEISIHFKNVPHILFNADRKAPLSPNVLTIRIQPNEGISLRFQVKVPGLGVEIRPLQMNFGYADGFGKEPPEAYERLLIDAASGDPTLFPRSDEVEAAWRYVKPIIAGCEQDRGASLPQYSAGSWGPEEADRLLAADGRQWRLLRPGSRKRTKRSTP